MPTALASIRIATVEELPAICEALRRAGFSAPVETLMRMPLESACGHVYVARGRRERIIGVAAGLAYPEGASGWIGAVGVIPSARHRGIATALTETTIERLRSLGAAAIGLYATAAGLPVYERLGFSRIGDTVAWRGRHNIDTESLVAQRRIRPLVDADRAALAALDAAATGEIRTTMLSELRPLKGWATTATDGRLTGYSMRAPWGSSTAVIASDRRDGLALLATAVSSGRGGTVIVPEDNHSAAEAVRSWHLGRLNSAVRMTLGPPPTWRPEQQFGTFNLFWG